MSLSHPIVVLKSQARRIRRDKGIPLNQALDRIAIREGYASWSLLVARNPSAAPRDPLLVPGTLALVGARPGEGKTRYSVSLVIQGLRAGRPCWFFALHNERSRMREHFAHHGEDLEQLGRRLTCVESDDITADLIDRHIRLHAHEGSVVVVDYLQVLDQRRSAPELNRQLETLQGLARSTGATLVFLAQIQRAFDDSERSIPGLEDIRQVNPIDLSRFDQMLFMHGGQMQYRP